MDELNTDNPTDTLFESALVIAICAVGAIGIAVGIAILCIIFIKLNPVISILLGISLSLGSHVVWYEAGKLISLCLAFYIGIKCLGHRAVA